MGLGEGPGVGGQTWVGGGDGGRSLRRRPGRGGAVFIGPFSSNRPARLGELGVAGWGDILMGSGYHRIGARGRVTSTGNPTLDFRID